MKKLQLNSLTYLGALFLLLFSSCGRDESPFKPNNKNKFKTVPNSSLRVGLTATTSVTVYQHCNFNGYAVTLPAGEYTLADLESKGIKNDDLSSIQVASGYKVTLYGDHNFTGTAVVKTVDVSCLVADGFNDKTSSIKVEATSTVVWRKANLTNFESYPDPGSEECIRFNGCQWAGYFAFVDEKQSESWVKANNIVAVHSKDAGKYKLKTLRIRQGSNQLDVKVYDMCSDSDCDGCCTENCRETGFLIDIEKYTMQRFGSGDGIVEWTCLDCK